MILVELFVDKLLILKIRLQELSAAFKLAIVGYAQSITSPSSLKDD